MASMDGTLREKNVIKMGEKQVQERDASLMGCKVLVPESTLGEDDERV